MTTTTVSVILSKMRAVVAALAPAAAPTDHPFTVFERSNPPLRAFALNAAGACPLRLFQARRSGPRQDPGIMDPAATLVTVPVTVTIAYPVNPELFELAKLSDLEDLIDSDAQQVRDALYSVSGLANAAHAATIPTIEALDNTSGVVWFQDLTCKAVFYAAQEN